jgi:hypothetical protein
VESDQSRDNLQTWEVCTVSTPIIRDEDFYDLHFQGITSAQLIIANNDKNKVLRAFDFPIDPKEVTAFVRTQPGCCFKINPVDYEAVKKRNPHGVGGTRETTQLVCFSVDLDAGKGSGYPSHAVARRALQEMPLQPSAIVGSNGEKFGIHAYWWFQSPIDVTDENRNYLQTLNKSWHALLREKIQAINPSFRLDAATYGIERFLRCPGSQRVDSGNRVRILEMGGH